MNRMTLIQDFARLGDLLRAYLSGARRVREVDDAVAESTAANPWFTGYHIRERLAAVAGNYLKEEKLSAWLARYSDVWHGYQKEVAVVMAGNIPLAGCHDYLSVLASGRRAAVKLSSKDAFLLPALHGLLCASASEWCSRVRFVAEVPADTDGLIVTGSDSTAAWFAVRYPRLPKIVRGHRVSVAVVPEEMTQEQIAGLHRDMFACFGLGCRSVVRLFVPEGFDLLRLTAFEQPPPEASHPGFRNAFRRQKALLTMQNMPFTDGGFFVLQPANDLHPPVGTVFYTRYQLVREVVNFIEDNRARLQCVVGANAGIENCITFGSAQSPQLWDYADGIDTLRL